MRRESKKPSSWYELQLFFVWFETKSVPIFSQRCKTITAFCYKSVTMSFVSRFAKEMLGVFVWPGLFQPLDCCSNAMIAIHRVQLNEFWAFEFLLNQIERTWQRRLVCMAPFFATERLRTKIIRYQTQQQWFVFDLVFRCFWMQIFFWGYFIWWTSRKYNVCHVVMLLKCMQVKHISKQIHSNAYV